MATTRREPTIPATGAKRDGRVSLSSSTIPHHIKKTPIKSSSSSTTKRSTITSSVPRTTTTYKPILKPTINTSRLNDPSRKETNNKTSSTTTRSNNTNSSSSSAIQHNKKSISLNKISSDVKPPTLARLQKPSIQGGRISGGTTSTTSNKLPSHSSSTSKPTPVCSSPRLSARPAPVDRRKNVPQPSSAVWKPKTNSSTSVVRKTTSSSLSSSSSSKKDHVNGITKEKKKKNPKIATSKSEIEVKTQDNHKDELGDRHFESNNDDEGLANINVDHDHDELQTLPDMSEMPNEHLGDPTLSDHMEKEIVKISDNHHDINVDDHDGEVVPPASQDQDELENIVDHKIHDPEIAAEEGVINTSAVENEENYVEKSADHDQLTEAISKEEEEDQKNNTNAALAAENVNGGDEEQTRLESVGLELEKEEAQSEGANNKAEVGGDEEGKTDKAPANAEKTKNTSNNNVNLQGSSGGSSNSGKLNKKKDKAVYNDVIEETSKKLMDQNRRNKVKALAGAFETVISLQDSNTTKPATTN